jgi:anti-sigma regulatory factor (Ser/Thr protein kinase)
MTSIFTSENQAVRPRTTADPDKAMAMTYGQAIEENLSGLRDQVRALLVGWNVVPPVVEAATTVVSELFTNVIVHVGVGPCTVQLTLRQRRLTMRVRDVGCNLPYVPTDPEDALVSVTGESGRGLCIVAMLTDRFCFELANSAITSGKSAIVEWDGAA